MTKGKYIGKGIHIANFISARITCTNCEGKIQDCRICGPKLAERHKTWCSKNGINPIKSFIKWIMKFRDYETYAYGHYGG